MKKLILLVFLVSVVLTKSNAQSDYVSKESAETIIYNGKVFYKLGKIDEAIEYWKNAFTGDLDFDVENTLLLANAYFTKKRYDRVIKIVNRILIPYEKHTHKFYSLSSEQVEQLKHLRDSSKSFVTK